MSPAPTRPAGGFPSGTGEPSQTFRKADRILWRSRFLEVQGKGRKVHTRHFVLFLLPNDTGRTRLGVVVSRKVGGAVVRNRVRRRVREVFRQNRHLFPPSSDLVVVARQSAAGVAFRDLFEDLFEGARRLRKSARDDGRPGGGHGTVSGG